MGNAACGVKVEEQEGRRRSSGDSSGGRHDRRRSSRTHAMEADDPDSSYYDGNGRGGGGQRSSDKKYDNRRPLDNAALESRRVPQLRGGTASAELPSMSVSVSVLRELNCVSETPQLDWSLPMLANFGASREPDHAYGDYVVDLDATTDRRQMELSTSQVSTVSTRSASHTSASSTNSAFGMEGHFYFEDHTAEATAVFAAGATAPPSPTPDALAKVAHSATTASPNTASPAPPTSTSPVDVAEWGPYMPVRDTPSPALATAHPPAPAPPPSNPPPSSAALVPHAPLAPPYPPLQRQLSSRPPPSTASGATARPAATQRPPPRVPVLRAVLEMLPMPASDASTKSSKSGKSSRSSSRESTRQEKERKTQQQQQRRTIQSRSESPRGSASAAAPAAPCPAALQPLTIAAARLGAAATAPSSSTSSSAPKKQPAQEPSQPAPPTSSATRNSTNTRPSPVNRTQRGGSPVTVLGSDGLPLSNPHDMDLYGVYDLYYGTGCDSTDIGASLGVPSSADGERASSEGHRVSALPQLSKIKGVCASATVPARVPELTSVQASAGQANKSGAASTSTRGASAAPSSTRSGASTSSQTAGASVASQPTALSARSASGDARTRANNAVASSAPETYGKVSPDSLTVSTQPHGASSTACQTKASTAAALHDTGTADSFFRPTPASANPMASFAPVEDRQRPRSGGDGYPEGWEPRTSPERRSSNRNELTESIPNLDATKRVSSILKKTSSYRSRNGSFLDRPLQSVASVSFLLCEQEAEVAMVSRQDMAKAVTRRSRQQRLSGDKNIWDE